MSSLGNDDSLPYATKWSIMQAIFFSSTVLTTIGKVIYRNKKETNYREIVSLTKIAFLHPLSLSISYNSQNKTKKTNSASAAVVDACKNDSTEFVRFFFGFQFHSFFLYF